MAYTEKPWDGSASKYSSTASFCEACLINENDGPSSGWVQSKCHLPIKEPNGDINLNAVRNAMARINQVQASAASKAKAKARLQAIEKAQKIGAAGNKQQQ